MVVFGLTCFAKYPRTMQVTRECQIQLLLFLAFAMSVTSASFIAGDLATSESPEYQAYFAEVCNLDSNGNSWSTEWLAWKWPMTVSAFVATLSTYPYTLMLALRMEMWSPVFMDAMTTAADAQWLKRYPHV